MNLILRDTFPRDTEQNAFHFSTDLPPVNNAIGLCGRQRDCIRLMRIMARARILIVIAAVALVSSSEVEDIEQKKRGAAKPSNLNAIPTGAQKTDYTYSIYSQNPSSSNNSPNLYSQNQVPNSFYPSPSGSTGQYYSSSNPQDPSSLYPPQPQLNLIPPPTSSQFVPLNFVPNPGYQTRFQIIPSKTQNGNLQLAIVPQQQSLLQQQGLVSLPTSLFSPNQLHPQQSPVQLPQQGHFNIGSNFQPFPLTQPYVGGHPQQMFLFAQPSPSLYNNYLVPNTNQQLYNYFQPSSPSKYNLIYGGATQSQTQPNTDYEKYQAGTNSQPVSKDDNEISIHSSDYITPAETNTNYKNSYTTGQGSSYKS